MTPGVLRLHELILLGKREITAPLPAHPLKGVFDAASPRDRECLVMAHQGLSSSQIGEALGPLEDVECMDRHHPQPIGIVVAAAREYQARKAHSLHRTAD